VPVPRCWPAVRNPERGHGSLGGVFSHRTRSAAKIRFPPGQRTAVSGPKAPGAGDLATNSPRLLRCRPGPCRAVMDCGWPSNPGPLPYHNRVAPGQRQIIASCRQPLPALAMPRRPRPSFLDRRAPMSVAVWEADRRPSRGPRPLASDLFWPCRLRLAPGPCPWSKAWPSPTRLAGSCPAWDRKVTPAFLGEGPRANWFQAPALAPMTGR